jgi:tetratricopeptide (TPR) repeat protein
MSIVARRFLLTSLLLLGPAALALTGQSDDLTPEQRKRLESEAAALTKKGVQLYGQLKYAEAIQLTEQALAIRQRLYPSSRFPNGHPDLATSLNNLGVLHQTRGAYGKALPYFEQALAMRQRLYPGGHPDLATSLNNLGTLLHMQGEHGKALPYFEQALAMRQRLYQEKYPNGHPLIALSLNDLGMVLHAQGEDGKALARLEQALAMWRRLYPRDKVPDGHPNLALGLSNLGTVLNAQAEHAKALPYFEEALAMRQRLFPREKFPDGHPLLATSLNNLGVLLLAQTEYTKARPYYEQALAMRQRLYPREKYPDGHSDLANSLNNLGILLRDQGEYARALPYLEQALAMRQRLYPREKYPSGHPELATSLNNLGAVLKAQGENARALPFYEEALAMKQRLYPKARYPDGHPELATSLNNLGTLLRELRKVEQALLCHEQALAMRQRLYPRERYPDGHPDLAHTLHNLGTLLMDQGEHAQALAYLEQALAIAQRLYPPVRYPDGHPYLARSLYNLGALRQAQGEHAKALPYYEQALAMSQKQLLRLADSASEAALLNLLHSQPDADQALLFASRHVPGEEERVYQLLWQTKATLTRLLEQRHLHLVTQAESGNLAPRWQELLETRRRLARLLLAPPHDPKSHQEQLRQLTDAKEKLERELAERLPVLNRQLFLSKAQPRDLSAALPPGSVFIDLLHYRGWDPKQKRWDGGNYVAFVLAAGQPTRRVELGPAPPIAKALAAWREAIAVRQDSPAVEVMRRLVWDPVAKHLPPNTHTVYLAPEGSLSRLPWAALPGSKPGTVLLEDHALALVPHGLFLYDRLTQPRPAAKDLGTLLAVGGVRYDEKPAPLSLPSGYEAGLRAPQGEGKRLNWPPLPGTEKELEQLVGLAKKYQLPLTVLERRGPQASAGQVLLDLRDPKRPVRWAHFATHGFFADPSFRSFLQLDEKAFAVGHLGERRGLGARSPLVLSGLVLAGANLPAPKGKEADSDDGILTGEALASLDLRQLQLAVLSACDSGLGEEGGGEGVYGLQRAFHLAGTQNVVASLWKVSDEATAALMALFYHQLWQEKKTPLEALRAAQLTLYRHPERIPVLATERGLRFDRVIALPPGTDLDGKKTVSKAKASVKVWASFVLSGIGN